MCCGVKALLRLGEHCDSPISSLRLLASRVTEQIRDSFHGDIHERWEASLRMGRSPSIPAQRPSPCCLSWPGREPGPTAWLRGHREGSWEDREEMAPAVCWRGCSVSLFASPPPAFSSCRRFSLQGRQESGRLRRPLPSPLRRGWGLCGGFSGPPLCQRKGGASTP